MQWKSIIQLRLPFSLTNLNNHHPQQPTNPLPCQSQKSTQPKCNGRASYCCDCHFPSPTQTTTTPKAHKPFSLAIIRVNSAKVQWKCIIQLRLPLSLTNPNNHHPKSPLTSFPGNRKSPLSQTAMEELHPVASATFPHQPKQPPP